MSSPGRRRRPAGRLARADLQAVVLSLGSNLGDRLANLQLGIDTLVTGGLTRPAVSGVYETVPVGGPAQDDYLNVVLLAGTALSARDILGLAAAAETAASRVRTVRFGPRTLDVDIVAYGAERSSDAELTLPHPRAHERAFVLAPWLDVDAEAVLPDRGTVAELLAAIGTDGVRRRPDLMLTIPATAAEKEVVPCT
jgi:2-amino-4-hydroxy-6-hydroxymethyldihydropteridine diphosphokinase